MIVGGYIFEAFVGLFLIYLAGWIIRDGLANGFFEPKDKTEGKDR